MKAPSTTTLQRVRRVQHVVPEGLTDTVELGDEVTTLCGETFRLRYKDDPNYLTCGMCSLLLIREYRSLLTEHNELVDVFTQAVQEQLSEGDLAETVREESEHYEATPYEEGGAPDVGETTESPTVGGEEREESDGTTTDGP